MTELGTTGLLYGTRPAEEMIQDRMRRLAERGRPADRQTAVGQLAGEGNLKTVGEAGAIGALYLSEGKRVVDTAAQRGQERYEAAKKEAAERGVTLSEVMNEWAMRGEVKL